ncbi:DUF4136 domain-containing protein [Pseudomonas sp. NPDC078700]|uniref:DUF4136 domain-containing protein n=1 Tax=Pseudomonas sp. NPDC078700 TaxID=3364424 RepID=UPI0037C97233
MRLFLILLACMALTDCATPPTPQTEVTCTNPQALSSLKRFKLIAPEPALKTQPALPALYPKLASLLGEQLHQQGYQQVEPAQINVYYWLAVQDNPIEFKVDLPPPSQLGAYQAIHRLQDETGTLRVRLTDPANNLLWQGTSKTGLSPATYSIELVERAVSALTAQIPACVAP